MINKYGRRSKFGMKGTCSHFPQAGGTFQDCPALIAHVERCCGFIPTLSVLVQSLLKTMLSSPLLFVEKVMEIYRLVVLTYMCFGWAEVCMLFSLSVHSCIYRLPKKSFEPACSSHVLRELYSGEHVLG